jgi:hypothetical protein
MNPSEQTRRLKKYEASELVVFSQHDAPQMDFLSPFGPYIARTKVAADLVDHLNTIADKTLTPGQGSEFQLSSSDCDYGGDDSLANVVADAIRRYVRGIENDDVRAIEFDVFWVVSQYAGTPSPVHFHSGDISGVLYLKVPELVPEEEHRNYINGRQSGYINFLIGGKQRFSRSLISFKPCVGDLYIFPGWLLHGAEPFRGTGERRSLAFNAQVQS